MFLLGFNAYLHSRKQNMSTVMNEKLWDGIT